MPNYRAKLLDTVTGETAIHVHKADDLELPTVLYMWEEGNYSCDCNRRLFLHRALHDPNDWPDFACGEGRVCVQELINADTGEVVARDI